MLVKVGTYTGDGADNRSISGIGFTPELVIIKGGSNYAVWSTATMSANSSAFSSGTETALTDKIQAMEADGFQIGTDAEVNASGTTYYYVAIDNNGDADFFQGSYTGNATDNRSITGVGFQPDLVVIQRRETTSTGDFKTSSHTGEDTSRFSGAVNAATNDIQALEADGFQIGTGARVNTNLLTYDYFCVKNVTGEFKVGTYTGNGSDNRDITGLGFQPNFVTIKGNSTDLPAFRTSDYAADDTALYSNAASAANRIQSFGADGFQVGTDASVNTNTTVYYWFAFKNVAPATSTNRRIGTMTLMGIGN